MYVICNSVAESSGAVDVGVVLHQVLVVVGIIVAVGAAGLMRSIVLDDEWVDFWRSERRLRSSMRESAGDKCCAIFSCFCIPVHFVVADVFSFFLRRLGIFSEFPYENCTLSMNCTCLFYRPSCIAVG